jgi:hypothetical protein
MTGSPARAIVKRISTASLAGGMNQGTDPDGRRPRGHRPRRTPRARLASKQRKRLGIPDHLAHGAAASHVDWHQIARLVQRGCPPLLALSIVR